MDENENRKNGFRGRSSFAGAAVVAGLKSHPSGPRNTWLLLMGRREGGAVVKDYAPAFRELFKG
jgi:hypothetical protein